MAEKHGLDQVRELVDDDSRTFRDGPLQNFFRLRKWFILVIVLLVLLGNNWLVYSKIAPALSLDQLPLSEVRKAITLFGAYLALHAVLLILQLGVVYTEDVAERADSHGERKIRQAEERLNKRRQELKEKKSREGAGDTSLDADVDDEAASDPAYADEEDAIDRMGTQLQSMWRSYGRARGAIRMLEIVRDFIRIVPIFMLLAYSLLVFGEWGWMLRR